MTENWRIAWVEPAARWQARSVDDPALILYSDDRDRLVADIELIETRKKTGEDK
jgi:hypothetical protein